jgi:SAM-dependent methyltransferase
VTVASAASAPVTQYDGIATQYRQSKRSPLRRHVEAPSFLGWVGDVRGASVLELACGEGHYTRRLHELGAARVLALDISPAMIALAESAGVPAGVEYRVADAAALPALAVLGQFDLACAAYLLHYARDVDELRRMCAGIARQLPPGARFVTLNENPWQAELHYRGYLNYGFSKSVVAPRREAAPITYAMVSGRELFRFEVYHFEPATYEAALRSAGFTDIVWLPVAVDAAGIGAFGASYWAEYLDNPPVVGLSCRKAGA